MTTEAELPTVRIDVRTSAVPMVAIDLVTDAFSYTCRRIAERLVARGRRLRTLTVQSAA